MNWLLLALIPPIFWSMTNYFDKYLISKFFKGGGIGALMLFSSFIGLFLLVVIIIINPGVISSFQPSYLLMILNGFFYLLALLPYFYALQKNDASMTVPLLQMTPVISFFMGFFLLNETLSLSQIIGGILIITGAVVMSIEFKSLKEFKLKKDIFLLMFLSSFLFAINFLLFKLFALKTDFLTTSFYEYLGYSIFAVILVISIKSYRQEFLSVLRNNSKNAIILNALNEIINIIGKVSFNLVSLYIPVTLAWIVNGLQPLFIFIYGIILTIFFPKIIKENIKREVLLQKGIAIAIMFVGGIFLN